MNPQSPSRIAAVVAAVLLATACGAGPATTGAGAPTTSPSAVAYARCVRSHGVPNFPDPDSGGNLVKMTPQRLGVSDAVFGAATSACASLSPNQPPSPAQQRQQLADDVRFAQCMRSHGLPKFPDPTADPSGPRFLISISADGFDPHSPQILATAHQCQHVLPAGSRLPSVTVSQ